MMFSTEQPFVVVAAVIERGGKFLFIQENHPPDKGKWNIPAGKLELGEDPLEAVRREVLEESGLVFEPTGILAIHSVNRLDQPGQHAHVIRIVFRGDATGDISLGMGDSSEASPEIADARWLSRDEVAAMDLAVLRYHDNKLLVNDYLGDVNYPLGLLQHLTQQLLGK